MMASPPIYRPTPRPGSSDKSWAVASRIAPGGIAGMECMWLPRPMTIIVLVLLSGQLEHPERAALVDVLEALGDFAAPTRHPAADRKSVVEGKRVAVRVDIG